jgi:hypothetical protein
MIDIGHAHIYFDKLIMHLNIERLWTPILINYGHNRTHNFLTSNNVTRKRDSNCDSLNLIFLFVKTNSSR